MSPPRSTERSVIAVDGPGGVGKTTVCRRVAGALGWPHLDTGAFYRAATVVAVLHHADPGNEAEVMRAVAGADLDYRAGRMFIDGIDMSGAIRSEAVSARVSPVSALAGVRRQLVRRQREWVEDRGGRAVVEGRDIGTVVFPSAPVKVYLTALPEVRAARRAGQFSSRLEEVRERLARRDRLDSTRRASPMARAAGSVEIDTSEIGVDRVVEAILELAGRRGITPVGSSGR